MSSCAEDISRCRREGIGEQRGGGGGVTSCSEDIRRFVREGSGE